MADIRARRAIGALAGGAMVAAVLLWWAPSLLLTLGMLAANRAGSAATMAQVRSLRALEWDAQS